MRTSDFAYDLPPGLIAQEPVEPRDASRLLVLYRQGGCLSHRRFSDLPGYLQPGDVLVLNKTRVMPARLLGRKVGSGVAVECLLLKRLDRNCWECLVRPGRRLPAGSEVQFGEGLLLGGIEGVTSGGTRLIRFQYRGEWEDVLSALGRIPLPPYIKRELGDPERYQTVYGREPGSAAAPTAGLHFTDHLLNALQQSGITISYILLHVGLGTFKPVQTAEVQQHRMHSEYFSLEAPEARKINSAREAGRRVVSVGTTVTRTLETCASPKGVVQAGNGWTDLFIYPGYRFRVVDAMVTNFHLPRSTLLMLVSAFAGTEVVLQAYNEAARLGYRFYSFGDAMLII